jgi:hypothetical protein
MLVSQRDEKTRERLQYLEGLVPLALRALGTAEDGDER